MKESLEEINDDLEDKIIENEELQGKILELEETIDKLNNQIENEKLNNNELKEQIESLYTENELYEQRIFELIDFKKDIEKQIEDFCNTIKGLGLLSEVVTKSVNEIFDLYQNKCNELFEKKNHFFNEKN